MALHSLMHSHHINVQTEEEVVTVTIGGDGGIPGGFAKLFNRVIDSGAWGKLSDAARAAYLPLARFADQKNHFRIQMGQASLMRYSGLSRSSLKRAMKDLLASRLIVLVERGGVSEAGENECSIYQLMVPAERRATLPGGAGPGPARSTPARGTGVAPHSPPGRELGAEPAIAPARAPVAGVTPRLPASASARPGGRSGTPPAAILIPPGVRSRTPGETRGGPPEGSLLDPDPARRRTHPGTQTDAGRGSASGPQFRQEIKDLNNKTLAGRIAPLMAADAGEIVGSAPRDPVLGDTRGGDAVENAAALLRENGVEPPADRALAAGHPYERIVEVVATMQYRRARGKCDNPGGFIRDALVKQWQTPRAVAEARAKAEARRRQAEAEQASRASRTAERASDGARAEDEERRVERAVSALDEEELAILAGAVLDKYRDNPAVLKVLTRRPPRECRLMKMEIAAMLEGAGRESRQ